MRSFKTLAYIYSLNKNKLQSTQMDEVEIIGKLPNNQYKVNYRGVICTASFNSINNCYYVDDIYEIIKE